MEFNSSSFNNSSTSSSGNAFNGFHFDFPKINLTNITQSLNRSFSPQNLPNFMSPTRSSQQVMACQSCGSDFSFLKRKKSCIICSLDFCSSCIDNPVGFNRKVTCKRCLIFSMDRPLERNGLLSLRVRDLRWYLDQKRIPSHHCKEKYELVELILRSSPPFNQRNPNISSESRGGSENDDGSEWVFVASDAEDPSDNTNQTNDAQHEPHPAKSPTATSSQTKLPEFKPFNIQDIKSEDDVPDLSVRQLKLLLTRNFVNYRGCCEKEELQEKAIRLMREKRDAKDPDSVSEDNICKICMEQEVNCVLLECGHVVACVDCGKKLSECPVCRSFVVRAVRLFKS